MSEAARLAAAALVAAAVACFTVLAAAPGPADPLAARVATLEQAVKDLRAAPEGGGRTDRRGIEAVEARPVGGAAAEEAPRPAEGPAEDRTHQEVTVALTREPASGEHRAAVRRLSEHLVRSAGPPLAEREFAWAAGLLDREARRGRMTPEDSADLAALVSALPAGHAARPGLAKAAAVGWGRDDRLGGFLGQFAANAEPSLHQGILAALDDEYPGPAFSDYVLRLIREERDPEVLAVTLGLDRMEAAATAAYAPRLVQAIEARVLDGSLDTPARAGAGLAIAVAGIKSPETGAAALRRLAAAEADAGLAERFRLAATALEEGNATLKSLERLFP